MGLTPEQQQVLKTSHEEHLKQLITKSSFLKKRIQAIKKQLREILSKPPLNKAQEARAIERATLQQKVADIQEHISEISLTQGIIEKQRNEQLTEDFLVPNREAVASLSQRWAVERVELEKQLKIAQEKLARMHPS